MSGRLGLRSVFFFVPPSSKFFELLVGFKIRFAVSTVAEQRLRFSSADCVAPKGTFFFVALAVRLRLPESRLSLRPSDWFTGWVTAVVVVAAVVAVAVAVIAAVAAISWLAFTELSGTG